MSRYSARIRQLESKLVPGACPVCGGCRVDFVTVAPGQAVPRQACEACGTPHKLIVVEIDTDQSEPAAPEHNGAAETAREPRVRRRQYYGPR